MEPCDLTAVEARRLMGHGDLSSVELVRSCLDRTDAVDGVLNAMVTRADERALDEAQRADEARETGADLGPLHGLPIAIKDLQPTEGVRTTYGTPAFAEHVPEADAGIVARIRAAGGIVTAKTNIPEWSIGANTVNPVFGATGNPFEPDLTCGGSSGGSAVAVATGMAALATGSDHGGSLRIPAGYCGVVGFRATPGVVPHELRSMAQTFYSVQGPVGRTVADTALLLSVIAQRPSVDPMAFPLDAGALAVLDGIDTNDVTVGVSEDLGGLLVSDTIRRSFRDRVERLSRWMEPQDTAVDLRRAPQVDWLLRTDVFVAQFAEHVDSWGPDFNPNIQQTYSTAMTTPMGDIAHARRTQMELIRGFSEVFDEVDVLICPCVAVPPFPWTQQNPDRVDGAEVGNYMGWLQLTAALTVVGHPVVALPCGRDEQGTPFGLQVIGPRYGDRRVLGVAAALERLFESDPQMARPVPDINRLERLG